MSAHTVKRIALPAGWEDIALVECGHPGEGWLSGREFAAMVGVKYDRGRKLLLERDDMDKCTRRIDGHNTTFFRPKKLAGKAAKKGR